MAFCRAIEDLIVTSWGGMKRIKRKMRVIPNKAMGKWVAFFSCLLKLSISYPVVRRWQTGGGLCALESRCVCVHVFISPSSILIAALNISADDEAAEELLQWLRSSNRYRIGTVVGVGILLGAKIWICREERFSREGRGGLLAMCSVVLRLDNTYGELCTDFLKDLYLSGKFCSAYFPAIALSVECLRN